MNVGTFQSSLCRTKKRTLQELYKHFLAPVEGNLQNICKGAHINTLRTGGVIYIVKNPVPGVLNNFNPLNAELNPVYYLLALLAHHFLHVSRIRVKSLTFRLRMSYIYTWSTYS